MAKKRIYYNEFRRSLESESLKPVYFFTGAEAFLKEEGIRAIIDKAIEPSERNMNLEILYAGTDVSGQDVYERAQTLPFLGATRVLVIRQAEKWRANDLAILTSYCSDPSSSSIIVISSQEERLKLKSWKDFAAKAYHIECYPLFDNQLPGWVERRVADHGKRIARDAIVMLLEKVGQNLGDLDNEITKLVNYSGSGTMLSLEDIKTAAGDLRHDTVHEFNAALCKKMTKEAVRLAERILDDGIPPLQMLGAMSWHFRNLLTSREKLDKGESMDNVLIGYRNPRARKEIEAQLKHLTREDFNMIFRELLKLDELAKGGTQHWGLALQTMILKLCRSTGAHFLAR